MVRALVVCLALALSGASLGVRAADWAQFRGGAALGVAADARVPLEWSDRNHVAWRTPVPGAGWSQPIVVGGRIFLTTAVGRGADKPSGMGGAMSFSTWGLAGPPKNPIQWRVLCLDPADGKVLWSRTIAETVPKYGKHASNSYATETPCASQDTVFAFFGGTGTLVALDRDGEERWRREFGPQPIQNQFGTGSSPLFVQDSGAGRLFLQLYNDSAARLHCLDPGSGTDLWTADRSKGTSWSTPIAWNNAGTLEVVTAGQGMVIAYAADTGKERWRLGGIDTSFACSIVADADGVYLGTSSPGSRAPAYRIAPGHEGDLTPPAVQTATAAVPWSRYKSGAGMPSPVIAGDLLYFFGDKAVCYDKKTGVEKYRKRLPGGTTAVGCPLVVGDRIYLVNEQGRTVVMATGPEFKVLAESTLGGGDEIFWSTPAVTDDALLIRSSAAIYCIR
ncbi:MAG: PQQ-binding-like beta-propeller repeat protein [Planctomycetia bacterium]